MTVMRLRIRVSPWVHWYIASVALMAHLTGRGPDMAKLAYWVNRGVRISGPKKGAVA